MFRIKHNKVISSVISSVISNHLKASSQVKFNEYLAVTVKKTTSSSQVKSSQLYSAVPLKNNGELEVYITLDITLLGLILDKKQGEVHPESHTMRPFYVTGAFKDKCSLGHPNFRL